MTSYDGPVNHWPIRRRENLPKVTFGLIWYTAGSDVNGYLCPKLMKRISLVLMNSIYRRNSLVIVF